MKPHRSKNCGGSLFYLKKIIMDMHLGHYGKCFVFATKFKDRSQSPV